MNPLVIAIAIGFFTGAFFDEEPVKKEKTEKTEKKAAKKETSEDDE